MSDSTAVVVTDHSVSLGVIQASRPAEVVALATEAANALAGVIAAKKLFNVINGRNYVRCEGWTTLATMMGCLPREVSATRLEDGSYEAVVELVRMTDGAILTRASAECGADEATWKSRANYARRSMAVTRATSKACRIAFSWVMVLAGYEVTPAEEIPHDEATTETRRVHPEPPNANPSKSGGPVLPFGDKKGTPLVDLETDELTAVRGWCVKKDPVKFAQLIEQVDDVLSGRGGE